MTVWSHRAAPSGSFVERLLRGPWSVVWAGLMLAALNVHDAADRRASVVDYIRFRFVGCQDRTGSRRCGRDMGVLDLAGSGQGTWRECPFRRHLGVNFGHLARSGPCGRTGRQVCAALANTVCVAACSGGRRIAYGYGARLFIRLHIGALFSGIASGSLHGWLWFAAAFTGSLAGIAARPLFSLTATGRNEHRHYFLFGSVFAVAAVGRRRPYGVECDTGFSPSPRRRRN